MIVNSAQLEHGAAVIRERRRGPQILPRGGTTVSAAQLDTAAHILREAEPSVITRVSGAPSPANGGPQERPGFIEPNEQRDPEVLVFDVGILPSRRYRIDRKGKVIGE